VEGQAAAGEGGRRRGDGHHVGAVELKVMEVWADEADEAGDAG